MRSAGGMVSKPGDGKGLHNRRVQLDAEREDREAPIDEGVHPTTPQ
jgi:hypothetical protein